jgi:hypothetical protein
MHQTLAARPAARSIAPWPWLMTFGRVGLFAVCQALFALALYLTGSPEAWQASAAWWPFTVALTNLLGLALLTGLYRDEGERFWAIFRLQREHLKSDLLAMLGLSVLIMPVAFLPDLLLANALFGSLQAAVDHMLLPLPVWAAYASLLVFPLTQGLVELPTYFVYAMPRLERQGLPAWLALTVPAVMLGLQHMAVPLLFDARYLAWRGLMFIPFAFFAGLLLRWRPRLLPYVAAVHVLMDLSFASMLLPLAY